MRRRTAPTTTVNPTQRRIALADPPPSRPAVRILRGVVAFVALAVLVAGVPWALTRYVGWPLPHHVPTWTEIQAALTTPPTTSLLLNVLAVLCWAAWVAFLVNVLRAVPSAVRTAAPGEVSRPTRRAGRMPGLAATLVTTLVLAVLAHRVPPDAPTTTTSTTAGPASPADIQPAAHPVAAAHDPSTRTVVVRHPHDGIHDCLWRIADRELGDGTRWPEIYQLNRGRHQADGRTLSNPNLIYPGWILVLPDITPTTPTEPPGPDRPPAPTTHATSTPAPAPSPPPTVPPSPDTPDPSPTTPTDPDRAQTPRPTTTPPATPTTTNQPALRPGIDLGPGAFVGLGLAAAISTAFLVARRRRRRWYQPGSERRTDLPVAPVVRTLRIAHLRHTGPNQPEPPAGDEHVTHRFGPDEPLPSSPRDPSHHMAFGAHAAWLVGIRDDHDIALQLAATRGLGLVGPGAESAARALLLSLLTTSETPIEQVLVPQRDVRRLLDTHDQDDRWPARLHVVPDIGAALDELEARLVHRARLTAAGATADRARPPVVLIATPHAETHQRMQAILENGSTMGILGILLDQWRPGATAHVRGDGTIGATNPGPAEQLQGGRLFTLPGPESADLLALLHDADDGSEPPPADTTDQKTTGPGTTAPSPSETTPPAPPIAAHTPADVHTGDPSARPLWWAILGTPRLTWHQHGQTRDLTTALTPRQHELLVFLALHPDGVPRDTVAEMLWPHGPTERPANALHTTLSRLRRALTAASSDDALAGLVTTRGDRYQLDPGLVDVDYWHLVRAVDHSRAADGDADRATSDRATSDRQIVATYSGELGAGLHADWLDVPREAARRDAIDAAARLARTLVATDPEQALHLIETARGFDPYNELIYRDIMRLQARLGRPDAIARTLSLLTTRLAELDEHPDPTTVTLARDLQHRQPEDPHPDPSRPAN